MQKGHYGQYTGNTKCCRGYKTNVTDSNYKATERDDAAHIVALEKDMKYDKKYKSPAGKHCF